MNTTTGFMASPAGLILADLPDARRGNKPWLPTDDRDVTAGRVTPGPNGRPRCLRHGAMNRVHPADLVYRCQEMYCGVGAQLLSTPPDYGWPDPVDPF